MDPKSAGGAGGAESASSNEADLREVEQALRQKLAHEVDPTASSSGASTSAATEAGSVEAEAEAEASRHGWVPRDKYKGDPAKWKPASQYLEDGRKFNKRLQGELEELKSRYSQLEKTGQAFAKFHEEAMAKKEQEIKDTIKSLRKQAREAVRDGDDDLAEQLEDRVDLLAEQQRLAAKEREEAKKREIPATVDYEEAAANAITDPVVQEWVEDGNEWFNDAKLRAYALAVGHELRKAGDTSSGRRFLNKVSEKMAEDFPRRFSKETSTSAAARADLVESGNGRANRSEPQYSVHDLPAVDLALMKEFIAKGWTTKEKFLKNYFSEGKRSHRG